MKCFEQKSQALEQGRFCQRRGLSPGFVPGFDRGLSTERRVPESDTGFDENLSTKGPVPEFDVSPGFKSVNEGACPRV